MKRATEPEAVHRGEDARCPSLRVPTFAVRRGGSPGTSAASRAGASGAAVGGVEMLAPVARPCRGCGSWTCAPGSIRPRRRNPITWPIAHRALALPDGRGRRPCGRGATPRGSARARPPRRRPRAGCRAPIRNVVGGMSDAGPPRGPASPRLLVVRATVRRVDGARTHIAPPGAARPARGHPRNMLACLNAGVLKRLDAAPHGDFGCTGRTGIFLCQADINADPSRYFVESYLITRAHSAPGTRIHAPARGHDRRHREEVAASHLGVGDRLAPPCACGAATGGQGDPLLWIDLLFTDREAGVDTRRNPLADRAVVHDVSSSRARTPFPVLTRTSLRHGFGRADACPPNEPHRGGAAGWRGREGSRPRRLRPTCGRAFPATGRH